MAHETEMKTLPSLTDEQKFIMKKALYYAFILFNRNNKPFNDFLRKNKLTNQMYTLNPTTSVPNIMRYEKNIHDALIINKVEEIMAAVETLEHRFVTLDQDLFNPQTSEQIDKNIKMLLDNFAKGAPLYECSSDSLMTAMKKGQFDEILSDENKENIMKVCKSQEGGRKKRRKIKYNGKTLKRGKGKGRCKSRRK